MPVDASNAFRDDAGRRLKRAAATCVLALAIAVACAQDVPVATESAGPVEVDRQILAAMRTSLTYAIDYFDHERFTPDRIALMLRDMSADADPLVAFDRNTPGMVRRLAAELGLPLHRLGDVTHRVEPTCEHPFRQRTRLSSIGVLYSLDVAHFSADSAVVSTMFIAAEPNVDVPGERRHTHAQMILDLTRGRSGWRVARRSFLHGVPAPC